ncbi:ROK family protein [Chitinophagaceae bacterium LB-8]|uniref:ROK family protein n=1 Tax=Paraflavisolibacter caeni TaxID=2982496 RepID=A0A9X3B7S4_9BACT|nr:ROK family protein [Paraflavisolibacter caeni]MCU7548781.1 ROK family protein [Paraflavisolibacter caeni]
MEKKKLYKGQIVKELYFANTLSCAELSLKINKSLPLTTKILDGLIEENWVVETGYAPSTGGRRPIMYSLKQDVMYIVAVSMDQFVTRIAIMDMQNNYISEVEKFELPLAKNSKALSILTDKISEVIKASGIPKSRIAGIGVGMPGFVDVKKGINYSYFETNGKNITENISEKVGLPVFIDNDSSLIALAEFRFGAARGAKDAMIVNIGWGSGLGMILNGELYRGHNGLAGEFSHIPLFLNGKLCSCGKRGCLETESSLLVVLEKARNGLRAGRESMLRNLFTDNLEQATESIITAAQEGDQFAIELLSEAGYNIGRGVAILIHLLNPREIILSGRGALAGKIWQAPIQQAINEHCIPKLATHTVIEISTLGYQAELIGAASLVMDNYEKSLL